MKTRMRTIDRRDFLKYAGSIGGGIFIGGGIPLPRMAAAKTRFTVASTGGSWGEAVKKIFVEGSGFKKKLDVDVDYEFNIDAVVVAKALANKENPIFDVSSASTGMATKMYVGGAVMPELDLDIVTNWPDIYPQARMGKHYAAYCLLSMLLVYNEKYVNRPESYKDLWNPKYKGHVGFSNYKHVGSYWLHAINRFFGGSEDDVTPGIEALAELMKDQKAVPYDNTDHAMKLFQREELWIAPFWDGRARQLKTQGLPIEYVWTKDWLPFTIAFVVLKNTKVPKIAMEFVNATLDPDVQVEWMKQFKYAPANRKCKIPKGYENVAVPEETLEKAADLDWITMVNNVEKNMELWNKYVLGT